MTMHYVLFDNGVFFFGRQAGTMEQMRPDNSWQTLDAAVVLARFAAAGIDIASQGTSNYDIPRPALIGRSVHTPHGVEVIRDAGVMGSGQDGLHITITTDSGAYTFGEWQE